VPKGIEQGKGGASGTVEGGGTIRSEQGFRVTRGGGGRKVRKSFPIIKRKGHCVKKSYEKDTRDGGLSKKRKGRKRD